MANAFTDSRLPYFRGKGQVEEILMRSGLSYAIIRPTLVFGEGDLLLNNMAWALRRFPIFPVYGNGGYPIQPMYAGDLTAKAIEAGSHCQNWIADNGGPDISLSEGCALTFGRQGRRQGPVGGAGAIESRGKTSPDSLIDNAWPIRTTVFVPGFSALTHRRTLSTDPARQTRSQRNQSRHQGPEKAGPPSHRSDWAGA